MKNQFGIGVLLFSSLLGFSQDFEGAIEYKISNTSNHPSATIQSLEEHMGTQSICYFKKGNYKEITNSVYMGFNLFRPDKKRVYYKHNLKDDTLRYTITSSKPKSKFTYDIYENTDTILGVICNRLVVNEEHVIKTYYYSNEYSLNPKHYKSFTLFNKYEIVKLMKAVYLKCILDYRYYTIDIEATKITRMKLPRGTFEIPKHQFLKKE